MITSKSIALFQVSLYILLFCFFFVFCIAALANGGDTQGGNDTAVTIGGSIAGSTFLNQALERFKPGKKVQSVDPGSQDEMNSSYSLIGTALRVGAIDKDVRAIRTKVSIIDRRVKHLETFLTKRFPEDFDPRNTS